MSELLYSEIPVEEPPSEDVKEKNLPCKFCGTRFDKHSNSMMHPYTPDTFFHKLLEKASRPQRGCSICNMPFLRDGRRVGGKGEDAYHQDCKDAANLGPGAVVGRVKIL